VTLGRSTQPITEVKAQAGVPAAVTIAQAILESGWGEHHLGEANNYFGIKAFKRNGTIDFGSIAIGFAMIPTREVIM